MQISKPFLALILNVSILLGISTIAAPTPQASEIGFAKPSTWLFGSAVASPAIPLLGDVNGDSYADFIYVSPNQRSVDIALNGRGWKPLASRRVISNLPETMRSASLGHFGGQTIDIAFIDSTGNLSIALSTRAGEYPSVKSLGTVSGITGQAWLLTGRLSPQSADILFVVTPDGSVRVIDASGALIAEHRLCCGAQDAVAADVDGDGITEIIARSGSEVIVNKLGDAPSRLATIHVTGGKDALAASDINGDGKADILANGRMYLAPGFTENIPIPGWDALKVPVLARMADIIGNGRADLFIQHRGQDRYAGTDCDAAVYPVYSQHDTDWDFDGLSNTEEAKLGTDALDRDTDNDGLLDGWEVHGFQGNDLPGLGANPLHRDLFVENLVLEGVAIDQVDKQINEEIVPLYASLPCKNPDGKPGVSLHVVTNPKPYPRDAFENAGDDWTRVYEAMFDKKRSGIWHWIFVTSLGPGGHTIDAPASTAGMKSWTHELGHQLYLTHSGEWPQWSPTYTSLMNYTYSYQFCGDAKKCHYSTGDFAGIVLNETRLPGKLPFPVEKLQFLSDPPLSFRLKSAGPDASYVDWGWTATFSEKPVRANITYGYGLNAGRRKQPVNGTDLDPVGKNEELTDLAPELVTHKGDLFLLTALRESLEPDAPRPKEYQLVMHRYAGNEMFGAGTPLAVDCIGDPTAVSDGNLLYVLYPTAEGIAYRSGQPDALGAVRTIPGTKNASVRVVCWQDTVFAFFWYGPNTPIRYCSIDTESVGPILDLGITSMVPPGPAVDTIHKQLLLGTAGTLGKETYRWQLRRFDRLDDRFQQRSWEWFGGPKSGWRGNRRPVILFDSNPAAGKDGRIYFIARGLAGPTNEPGCFFIAQSVPYKDFNSGWLLKRVYDEWTKSRTAIGATLFENQIILSPTWASDDAESDGAVYVCYHGDGVNDVNMSDSDDVSVIANFGISRSINAFTYMPSMTTE